MRALIIAALLLMPTAPLVAGPVEEQNKKIVSTIFTEIFGQWRIDENEHIYSPDYVGHAGDQHYTRAEDRAAAEGWKTFAPDGKMTILQIIAEGDLVAVLWTGEGINTGEGNGLPATGRPFRVTAMTMFRLADGKIIEEWNVFDNYSFLSQLGLLPKAGG